MPAGEPGARALARRSAAVLLRPAARRSEPQRGLQLPVAPWPAGGPRTRCRRARARSRCRAARRCSRGAIVVGLRGQLAALPRCSRAYSVSRISRGRRRNDSSRHRGVGRAARPRSPRATLTEAVDVVAQRAVSSPLGVGAGEARTVRSGRMPLASGTGRPARCGRRCGCMAGVRLPSAPAASACGRCTVRPLGVYQRAVVSLMATSSPSG